MRQLLRIIIGIAFSIIGLLHFKNEENFRNIVPDYLPFRKAAVLITGVFEIMFGIVLISKRPSSCLKKGINAFLLAVLPANIYMAQHNIPLGEKKLPKWALYCRLPLQFVMMSVIHKL
ncbi:hypothetical protein AST12_05680 [Staphylococcus succinus]|nr:hypothetical protein AST12_05680 [Staphylococcus succinus]